MAAITKKRMMDDVLNLLTQFSMTDDHRFATIDLWLSMKIDQIRSQLIIEQYQETGVVDYSWLTDLGMLTFYPVNFADDPAVTFCCSEISKSSIPNVVPIQPRGDANLDLGVFSIRSACGTKEYYPFPMSAWTMIPAEHVRSKFSYYSRVNTAIYVNKSVTSLKVVAVLASPEDGYIINSVTIPSGSIVTGTVYVVKNAQIVYNGVVIAPNQTFTGVTVSSVPITDYTGTGNVYLNSQLVSINETQPYPVNPDMARMITLEIMKEFGIEKGQITDILNDSVDDTQKVNAPS